MINLISMVLFQSFPEASYTLVDIHRQVTGLLYTLLEVDELIIFTILGPCVITSICSYVGLIDEILSLIIVLN